MALGALCPAGGARDFRSTRDLRASTASGGYRHLCDTLAGACAISTTHDPLRAIRIMKALLHDLRLKERATWLKTSLAALPQRCRIGDRICHGDRAHRRLTQETYAKRCMADLNGTPRSAIRLPCRRISAVLDLLAQASCRSAASCAKRRDAQGLPRQPFRKVYAMRVPKTEIHA